MNRLVFYENLPRFCPHCKIVGHTEDSCKVKKSSNKTDPAKAVVTVTEVEKEAGPKMAETGDQIATSGTGKSKGSDKKSKGI